MEIQILLIFLFTLIIHAITTLSYSVRIVGITTGRIAISFALFNILVLISRTSNAFQAPLLAKKVEYDILFNSIYSAEGEFRLFIIAASVGTFIGALFLPTFQRLFSKFVLSFNFNRSVPRVLLHGFTKSGIKQIVDNLKVPDMKNITQLKSYKQLPVKILILNMLAVSLLTVGVFSAIYAGYYNPDYRVTSSTLAAIINGFATIMLFVFIDPFLSALTDDVIEGKNSESFFRVCVVLMVISRFAGTILAQLLFIPATHIISAIARLL
jgi:hypothetical protein